MLWQFNLQRCAGVNRWDICLSLPFVEAASFTTYLFHLAQTQWNN
jgi:hypothetical protein